MKVWAFSDLHLDVNASGTPFRLPDPHPDCDVVAIAGDICEGACRAVEWIRSQEFRRPVVFVAGNHEYYGYDRTIEMGRAKAMAKDVPHLHFLQNEVAVIDGARILGATLWTDYRLYGADKMPHCMIAARQGLMDHQRIRTGAPSRVWAPADCADEHHRSVGWMEVVLDRSHRGPTIIVTHHAPSYRSVDVERFGDVALNAAYASDLDKVVDAAGGLWIHGHTHHAVDYRIGDGRVVCNPCGYVRLGEKSGWNPSLVVDV